MKTFILAVQFMTRIPININLDVKREDFKDTVKFFPIIGLIVGCFEAFVYYICSKILSNNLASFITILSHIVITGGIHIDGLSDTIDGIFSGRSKQKILEIMKDSRVGTFGALAIIFLVVGKIIMLIDMPEDSIIIAIILAPVISRTMNIFLMYNRKYAREEEGMGDLFIGVLDKKNYIICLISCIIIIIAIGGLYSIIIFTISFIFTKLFRSYIEKKIEGLTGDILGASSELNEFLIYLLFNF